MSQYSGKYSGEGYTDSQKETHDLIKSLHEGGLGYRRIAHHLNDKNITTQTGKQWKGNHVFAVPKRYREREERLSQRKKCLNQKFQILKLGGREITREKF